MFVNTCTRQKQENIKFSLISACNRESNFSIHFFLSLNIMNQRSLLNIVSVHVDICTMKVHLNLSKAIYTRSDTSVIYGGQSHFRSLISLTLFDTIYRAYLYAFSLNRGPHKTFIVPHEGLVGEAHFVLQHFSANNLTYNGRKQLLESNRLRNNTRTGSGWRWIHHGCCSVVETINWQNGRGFHARMRERLAKLCIRV